METTGKVVNITRDIMSGKLNITFLVDTDPVDELNDLKDIVLDIVAKKHRKKRSLDANAYFHVLVGKIAEKFKISKTYAKNTLIGRYGQIDFLDDQPIVIKTNVSSEKMMEQETLHCLPCGVKIENDKEVYFYKVMRGSHTYDTMEMSILIDGTVQEAKALGIETLSPDELRRMVETWQKASYK